jgi:predicted metal-dependent phosphoesterase TrpH
MNDMEAGIANLAGIGLTGMEVHYAKYHDDTIRQLARLAREYDLIPCGGSDYHGLGNTDECLPGENGPPLDSVDRLEAAAQAVRENRTP